MKMPYEVIGEVGTPSAERKRIAAESARAIEHLKKVLFLVFREVG